MSKEAFHLFFCSGYARQSSIGVFEERKKERKKERKQQKGGCCF